MTPREELRRVVGPCAASARNGTGFLAALVRDRRQLPTSARNARLRAANALTLAEAVCNGAAPAAPGRSGALGA